MVAGTCESVYCKASACLCHTMQTKAEVGHLQMIKYGVIGTQLLYDDLQYWDSLYIAGRMQKPVLMLKDYAKLPMARKNNLDSAVTMALLLLPERFTLQVFSSARQLSGNVLFDFKALKTVEQVTIRLILW